MDYPDEFMELMTPGTALRVFYSARNINNELRHVRAVVDDEYIVYRVWWRHHRRWEYKVVWLYGLYLDWRDGYLKKA